MSAAAEAPRLHRRGRALRVGAGMVALIAAGGAVWALLPGARNAPRAVNDAVPMGSAAVERRDLVQRQDVSGTLGYAGSHTVSAPSAGMITRLRAEGTTVGRGRSLMSIDAKPTAWVIYGTIPMYRDLGPAVTDGADVRQLERNLLALGYDPGTVDEDWTWLTTAAVKAFQKDRGLTQTGTLRRTDVVISNGPARVGAHKAAVGDAAHPGAPVTELTSTTPAVTAKIDAGIASSLHQGAAVGVTLPDGTAVRGRITNVGTVATAGQNGASPTIDLDVSLPGRRHGRFDGAPVTLSLAIARTKGALAVPVPALVAYRPSEYAVELAGSRALVHVKLGAFADGWVEVSGAGLTPGARVVVPR